MQRNATSTNRTVGSRKAKRQAKKALKKISTFAKKTAPVRQCKNLRKRVRSPSPTFLETAGDNNVNNIASGRKRWKTLNEREVLECYFKLDPDWSRRTILYVKDLVQLSEKQIYKWGYEKRRRLNLFVPQDKVVDMKLVTKLSDLLTSSEEADLNLVVSNLFPEDECEEETLSDTQKSIYDRLKLKLIERSMRYEQQSDLDKLLNERIPIENLAIEAKDDFSRLSMMDTNAGNFDNLSHSKHYCTSESTNRFLEPQEAEVLASPRACSPASESSYYSSVNSLDYDTIKHSSPDRQFGSEKNLTVKDSINCLSKKDTDTYEDLARSEDEDPFAPKFDSFLGVQDQGLVKDTFTFMNLESLPNGQMEVLSSPIPSEEELKYESLNELCSSLFSKFEEVARPMQPL